jgi:outer membrane protein assembly factor BamB
MALALGVWIGLRVRKRHLDLQAEREMDEELARKRADREADPANLARPVDAPAWTANPFESQPVTHLRKVSLTSATDPRGDHEAETTDAEKIIGATVAGGRPVLFSCGRSEALGPGFTRLRSAFLFDEWSQDGCEDDFVTDGPMVYLLQREGDGILALDLAASRIAWQSAAPTDPGQKVSRQLGHLQLAGDRILARAGWTDGTFVLAAYQRATGALAWTHADVLELAAGGAGIFVLDHDRNLSALDPATGAASWTVPLSGFAAAGETTLAAGGGAAGVVAVVEHEKLTLRSAADGHVRVETSIPGFDAAGGVTQLVFQGQELYACANRALVRLDPATGEPLWSQPGHFDLPVRGRDAVFATRTHVRENGFVQSVDAVVHAFDPGTGKELWSYGAKQTTTLLQRSHLSLLEVAGSEIVVVRTPWSSEITLLQRGPDEVTAHETLLDVTYPEAPAPPDGYVEIGGARFVLDEKKHWQGKLRGRGKLLLTASAARFRGADPVLVDLDDAAPTTTVELAAHAFQQACAGAP